jgi:hypothetical protein
VVGVLVCSVVLGSGVDVCGSIGIAVVDSGVVSLGVDSMGVVLEGKDVLVV